MSIVAVKWTLEDYHQLIAAGVLDNKSVELLQGEVVQMSPEAPLHSNCIRQSAKLVRKQVSADYEVSEAHPITLSDSEPEPDIALIRAGNYDTRHPGAEDTLLVIEFANTSLEKDLEEKRLTYARAGIVEYWVVDLRDRRVIVFRTPLNGDYQSRQVFAAGAIASLACPEVSITVAALLGTP